MINTANSLCELHSNIKIIIFQQAYIVYILAVKHKKLTVKKSRKKVKIFLDNCCAVCYYIEADSSILEEVLKKINFENN